MTETRPTPAAVLDMNELAGNEAVSRTLQRPLEPRHVRERIRDLGNTLPDHGQAQGRVHPEVWMRFPRSWAGQEAEQTLSETSVLLFESMKSVQPGLDTEPDSAQGGNDRESGSTEGGNDREVQGMLINDRLVFASNFNSSVLALVRHGERVLKRTPTLAELLQFQRGDGTESAGLRAHEAMNRADKLASLRRKNQAIFSEQRGEGEQGRGEDATAMALRAKTGQPVIVVDVEDKDLRTKLTSDKYEGRVFLLTFGVPRKRADKSVHAEQKLLLALHRAGIRPRMDLKKPISIMGKYRPCMGCAAALMYYRERLGFEGMRFDPNYGHYYVGAVESIYDHQRHIMDEHYLEYMRQMIQEDLVSTPGMMHEAAPPGNVYRNGGPTFRTPSRYAARQGDVTPADSDTEFDDAGTYRRIRRQATSVWSQETAKLGIGYAHGEGPMLTDDQKANLSLLWNGGPESPPTNESRQQAVELAYSYKEAGITVRDLAASVGVRAGGFGQVLLRYEREGHWTHVPTRSRHVETHKTVGRHFTKGKSLDRNGKDTIKAVIRSLRGDPWCAAWEKLHNDENATGKLRIVEAPPQLLETLLTLRDEDYDVPSMARYLHIGGEAKDVQSLRRKLDGMNRKREKAKGKAVAEPEDVEMSEAPDYPAGTSTSYYGGGGESSSAGAGHESGSFQVPGYELRHDPSTGQYYYVDEQTGSTYVNIGGRMVAVSMQGPYNVQTSNWQLP
jgi:hypothetical protein